MRDYRNHSVGFWCRFNFLAEDEFKKSLRLARAAAVPSLMPGADAACSWNALKVDMVCAEAEDSLVFELDLLWRNG